MLPRGKSTSSSAAGCRSELVLGCALGEIGISSDGSATMTCQDRVAVLHSHVLGSADPLPAELHRQSTAAALPECDSVVAVALPERLSDASSWTVRRYMLLLVAHLQCSGVWQELMFATPDLCRSVRSPQRLVSHFEPPDDGIRTLHDNWEAAVARYADVGCPWSTCSGQEYLRDCSGEQSHVLESVGALMVDMCCQAPFLGTRAVDSTGKAGPYQWMTYGQVGSAIWLLRPELVHGGLLTAFLRRLARHVQQLAQA